MAAALSNVPNSFDIISSLAFLLFIRFQVDAYAKVLFGWIIHPFADDCVQKLEIRQQATTVVFIALASTLRLFKHAILGPAQFVNFPAIFTVMGGLMFGYVAGAFIGVMSFVVSDVLLGYAGVWTVFTSLSMGFVGILSSFLGRINADSSALGLGVCSYLLILIYDILSSVALLIPLVPIQTAFLWSIIGLFLPSSIALYPVGLVTEIVTVVLIVLIYPRVRRIWKEAKS